MSYKMYVTCYNCGWRGSVTIPGGEEVSTRACPVCECKTLSVAYGAQGVRAEPKE